MSQASEFLFELDIAADQDIAKYQTVQIESQQTFQQVVNEGLVRQKVQNFDKDGKPAEEMAEKCDLLEEFEEEDKAEKAKTKVLTGIKGNIKKMYKDLKKDKLAAAKAKENV